MSKAFGDHPGRDHEHASGSIRMRHPTMFHRRRQEVSCE